MAAVREYIITKEDEGLPVRQVLIHRLGYSSRFITKLKYHGEILLNKKHANVNQRVFASDVLEAVFPEEESYFAPEDIPFDILFEDDDLMIINKPAGIVVHPTRNFPEHTLANALAYYIAKSGKHFKIRFVNRLDMGTSGLIIVAKNAHAQDFLSAQMSQCRVEKRYFALLHGIVEGDGCVDAPIDKDPNHVARRTVIEGGYPSVTHYKAAETFPFEHGMTGALDGYTLAELKLDTGRTHQIRVHMTHIGHPIVGDELYAQLFGYVENERDMQRPALHSHYIAFEHPLTGKLIEASAPLPDDINAALCKLRAGIPLK